MSRVKIRSVNTLRLLVAALVLSAAAPAAAAENPPMVELYTMGKGQLVWERWGHIALCLRYDEPRRDVCYNYGTTYFGEPLKLGWGFLRGDPVFWVSRHRPEQLLRDYVSHDRTVWRQRIPVEADEARALAARLREKSRPENRHYVYHHFYDNCSTRVRDLIDEAMGGALSRGADEPVEPTYRDYAHEGFAGIPSLLLASDLFLGRPADEHPTEYQTGFLPDELRRQVHERLGVEPAVVYERRGAPIPRDPGPTRFWWFAIALAVAAPALIARLFGRFQRLGLALSAVPLFLLGALVWGLAIVGQMPELRFNEVLFVFMPFDLALPFLRRRWRIGYARARVLSLVIVSVLLAAGVFVQPLWLLIPVALLPNLVASF